MQTNENGIIRQRLPGIMSGRVMTALFAGGSATVVATGPFLMNPETIVPALLVSLGGTAGSFIFGVARAKKKTARYAEAMFGASVTHLESKSIAQAMIGIPFAPQRVLVNNTAYRDTPKDRIFRKINPLRVFKANPDAPLANATAELDNYILYTSSGVYLEQIHKPTALKTWDNAYDALRERYGINVPAIDDPNTGATPEYRAKLDAIDKFPKSIRSLKNIYEAIAMVEANDDARRSRSS